MRSNAGQLWRVAGGRRLVRPWRPLALQPLKSLHGPSVSVSWTNGAEWPLHSPETTLFRVPGRNPVHPCAGGNKPLGVELAARSLQLPPAVDRDNGESHALRGRTVTRSADHCVDPARPDIRSLALASWRRSRHADTESGNLRMSAMLPDSNRPCWMALPSGQAQCSGFQAQRVPASPFKVFASPCCGPADACAERRARHANTKHATTATPEAIKCHGKPVRP